MRYCWRSSLVCWRPGKLKPTESQTTFNDTAVAIRPPGQLHDSLVAMQKQLDTKYSVLEVLREVVSAMPEGVKMNYFVFKKDNTVTIRGQAPNGTDTDFVSGLEKSAMFSKVATGQSRKDPATSLTRFEIVCTLKSATGGTATSAWH